MESTNSKQTQQPLQEQTKNSVRGTVSLDNPLVSVSQPTQGVFVITLGASSEQVVTLTIERLAALEQALDQIKEAKAKGLVLISSQQDMFTVGADINLIRAVETKEKAFELARLGQTLFQKISSLPFPTIAAISGPCLGGGYELALACKYRICSDAKSTLIGLPEVKLGILPGFGGTQRLPRLIGLPKALDLMLGGKTLRAKKAVDLSLVSESVPYLRLQDRAIAIVTGSGPTRQKSLPLKDKFLTFNALGRMFVKKAAKARVLKETKGFYPAPLKILESAIFGLSNGIEKGLLREAHLVSELITTPESKALIRLFYLSEVSKGIGKSALKIVQGLQSVVVGAGTMGAGIAGLLAQNEFPVVLKDTSEAALSKGMAHINKNIERLSYLSTSERSFIAGRIEATTKDAPNISNAEIVIEAIIEKMDVKKQVLSDLAKIIPDGALLCTNTSSLSISEIADGLPSPERILGLHFFNPVEKMPLIEIVRGKQTSDRYVIIAAALAIKLGKFPVVVNDVPGFLVNRILCPYLNAALHFLAEGVSAEAIDKAALDFGMPMGPLRLLDEIGLDVAAHVSDVMEKGYGERMKAPQFAKSLVAANFLGKKSGRGFYLYDKDGKASANPELRKNLQIEKRIALPKEKISDGLILSLVNEAKRCLDEGVAGDPGKHAAEQIDLASVMGFGFPPFRGGVLHYMNTIGTKLIIERMSALKNQFGDRFQVWDGIRE